MMKRPSVRTIVLCVSFALLFVAFVSVLLAPGTVDKIEHFPGVAARHQVAIDFEKNVPGFSLADRAFIQSPGKPPSAIGILVGTHGKNDVAIKADLSIGDCLYSHTGHINDNQYLMLELESETCQLAGSDVPFNITIANTELEKLSAWAVTGLRGTPTASIYMKLSESNYLVGQTVYAAPESPAAYTRLHKIAALWDLSIWVAAVFFCIALLSIVIGALALRMGYFHAMGIYTFGIVIIFALVIPPFQGPDEPDFFWSYLRLTNQKEKISHFKEYAKKVHFERLKFNYDEKISIVDLERPSHLDLPKHVRPPNVKKRSFVTPILFRTVATWVEPLPVSKQLLVLRILLGALLALVLSLASSSLLTNFNLAYLMVPFLPFIAMSVSNYSALTSLYALIGIMVFRSLYPFKSSLTAYLFAFALGGLLTLCLFEARSTIPVVGLASVLVLANRIDQGSLRKAPWFWIALGTGMLISMIVLSQFAENTVVNRIYWLRRMRIPILRTRSDILIWTAAGIILLQILEYLGAKAKPFRLKHLPIVLSHAIWLTIGASLVLSLVVPLPNLTDIQGQRVDALQYITTSVMALLSWFRLSEVDFYLQSSFLAGFGWLQTIPPDVYLYCLIACTPMIAYLAKIEKPREPGLLGALLSGVGVFSCLAGFAYLAAKVRYNLHGRYLIGFNILAFVTLAGYIGALPFGLEDRFRRYLTAAWKRNALLAMQAVSYTYIFIFLLTRYY